MCVCVENLIHEFSHNFIISERDSRYDDAEHTHIGIVVGCFVVTENDIITITTWYRKCFYYIYLYTLQSCTINTVAASPATLSERNKSHDTWKLSTLSTHTHTLIHAEKHQCQFIWLFNGMNHVANDGRFFCVCVCVCSMRLLFFFSVLFSIMVDLSVHVNNKA